MIMDKCNRFLRQNAWNCIISITITMCAVILYLSFTGHVIYFTVKEGMVTNAHNITAEKMSQSNCQNMCVSRECVETANSLLNRINQSADPCVNFYTFACGKWISKYTKAENYSTKEEMEEIMKRKLKDIVEEIQDPPSTTFGKLKSSYNSCINYNSSDVNAIPSLYNFLSRLGLESWPLLPLNFRFVNPTFEEVTAILMAYAEFGFMNFQVSHLTNEASTSLLFNIHPGYSVLRDESQAAFYESRVKDILQYFDIVGDNSTIIWEDFYNIDTQLRHLYQASSERLACYDDDCADNKFHLMCPGETNETLVFICDIVKHLTELYEIENIYSNDQVFISDLVYIQELYRIFLNTTHRSLANYLVLRTIVDHLDHLNLYFRLLAQNDQISKHPNSNFETSHVRWKQCIWWLVTSFPYPLSKLYLLKQASFDEIRDVNNLLQKFLELSAQLVLQQNWMNEETRNLLNTTLLNVNKLLEQYTAILHSEEYEFLLQKFHPVEDSYFGTVLELKKNYLNVYLLHKNIVDELDFPPNLLETTAYNDRGRIGIHFGILLPPVYQYGRPNLLNLASIGHAIGHEIGHEIQFFFERDDLDTHDKEIFFTKRTCIEKQYSNFILEKIQKSANGTQTVSENFADMISIQLIDNALEQMEESSEDMHLKIPGLPYSTKQILYILLSQIWCRARSSEMEEYELQTEVHSSTYVRVNGMMQNSKKFSETFNCSEGSFMNPINKCSFYD